MDSILREISQKLAQSPEGIQDLRQLISLKSVKEFLVLQKILLILKGKLAEEMLSKRFTELSPEEKDIKQRSYKMAYGLAEFIIDPAKFGEGALKIAKHNKQLNEALNKQMGVRNKPRRSV